MTWIQFANPLGLWGLASLGVVLGLHLLRERSRRQVVSDLTLWAFLDLEVRGSRARRIPVSWLLVLDLLIAALLSLAWAQPQFEMRSVVLDTQHTIVVLDVSTSMQTSDVLPSRFARARLDALSLLSRLKPRDIATVVVFGAQPRWIGDTREIGLQELVARVEALQPGETGSQALEGALALALAVQKPAIATHVHVLTDAAFAEPSLELQHQSIHWHFYGDEVANQAVLSLEAEPLAGDEWQILARVANFGPLRANRIVTLVADGALVDSITLPIGPDSTVTQVWTLNGPIRTVTVALAGGDQLKEDDTASLGLLQGGRTRVGLVAGDPEPLGRALRAVPEVELRVMAPEEYLPGLDFDLLVFRGTLPDVWPRATLLVLDPPDSGQVFPVDGQTEVSGPAVPAAHIALSGLDFSGVRIERAWRLARLPDGFVPVLTAGGVPLLLHGRVEESEVYLLLADLDRGNLTQHPAFPSLVANLVRTARRGSLPGQIQTGEALLLPAADETLRVHLTAPGREKVEFHTDRPAVWPDTLLPGLYRLLLVDLNGQQREVGVGVNAGSLDESQNSPRAWAPGAQDASQEVAQTVARRTVNLMPWLLVIAIMLLFWEARLAWRS